MLGRMDNLRILLANQLQSSGSTFSCVSFPSFFAFQEGMWDTQISALPSSPTVSGRFLERPSAGRVLHLILDTRWPWRLCPLWQRTHVRVALARTRFPRCVHPLTAPPVL